MMKRLFSIVLVAFMFVFALSVSAADVDTFTATASKTEVNPGDTFTVAVNYSDVAKGIGGINITVTFDTDSLALDAIDTSAAKMPTTTTPLATAQADGYVTFVYNSSTPGVNHTTAGKVGVLSFTVKDTVLPGDIEIEVVAGLDAFYYDGQAMLDLDGEIEYDIVTVPLFDLPVYAFEGAEFVYDGNQKFINITGVGNSTLMMPAGVDVQYEGNFVTEVGTHTVTATFVDYNDPAVYNVEGVQYTAEIVITPAEVEIETLDVDNQTVTFTGVVDGDELSLDFDAITMDKVDGDEPYWLASGFVLAGDKAANYTLVTEEVEISEEDINPDNIVTVTLYCVYETDDDVVEEETTLEFYKGNTYTLTVEADGYEFDRYEIDGETVGEDGEYEFVAEEDFEIYAYLVDDGGTLAAITAALIGSSKKVKVYFDTIAGSQVHTQSVVKGECVIRPVNPTKGNLTFAGWYTDRDYKTLYDFDAPVTESFTLYAKWDAPDNRIIMTIDKVEAMVFGENVANDVPPIIVNDRTMLPARFVAESLGAKVSWDIVSRKATIVGNGVTIEIIVGETTAYVNGNPVTIDSPAFIRNDRTYTPVRFVAEALGGKVEWVAADRQVIITK